jgi:hypothetical protein
VAVVLETTVLDQSAGLDVMYGERAVATLEWIRAPEAVSGAEVAKQLEYAHNWQDDGEETRRLLRTVVVALAVLVVVAIGVLLGLRSYYNRRDRQSHHVELLNDLAN